MSEALTKAEREIADILQRLETETGSIVEHIGLSDVEVTTIADDRPQLQRRVVVTLKRMPGTRW